MKKKNLTEKEDSIMKKIAEIDDVEITQAKNGDKCAGLMKDGGSIELKQLNISLIYIPENTNSDEKRSPCRKKSCSKHDGGDCLIDKPPECYVPKEGNQR